MKRRFGAFTIYNAGDAEGVTAGTPFILVLSFGKEHGLVRKSRRPEWSSVIPFGDMELRYREGAGKIKTVPLTGGVDGRYEVHFLAEDLQELYEVELWCALDAKVLGSANAGVYECLLEMEIEEWDP